MDTTNALQALNFVRTKAPTIPLSQLHDFVGGKLKTSEGKTLMQCFDSDANVMDRAKGTHIIQEYARQFAAGYSEKLDRFADNGKYNVQAMQVSTDFPLWTTSGGSVFQNLADVDTGWVRSFREAKFDSGKEYLEYGESDSNIEFYEMKEGQNYRGNDLTGTKYSLYAKKYGASYNVTDETMMFNDFQANIDLTLNLMNAFAVKMQKVHYGVVVDSAVSNIANLVAWVAGSNTLERDIKTINAACDYVYNAMRDKVPNAATAKFLIYVNGADSLVSRVRQAISSTAPNLQTGYQITNRPLEVIPTSNMVTGAGVAVASTRIEVVYPGRLLVRGVKRDLMTERYRDQTKDINVTKANFYVGAGSSDITQTVFADLA
jgi:hypothetical protein